MMMIFFLIPIEEISKTVRKIEHHCLGQADSKLNPRLLKGMGWLSPR